MKNVSYFDAITVEVDGEIESIVPEFLENRAKDCEQITRLLEKGEFCELRTLGHRMKGAGGSYGFDGISEIGEIIEEAALECDGPTITNAAQRLVEYLKRVTVVYV